MGGFGLLASEDCNKPFVAIILGLKPMWEYLMIPIQRSSFSFLSLNNYAPIH